MAFAPSLRLFSCRIFRGDRRCACVGDRDALFRGDCRGPILTAEDRDGRSRYFAGETMASAIAASLTSTRSFQELRTLEIHPERELVPHPGLSSITDSLFHHVSPKISNDIFDFG